MNFKKIGLVLIFSGFIFLLSSYLAYAGYLNFLSPQANLKLSELTGKYDFSKTLAVFNNKFIKLPRFLADGKEGDTSVLGEFDSKKRLEVDLTNQRIYAFEGNRLVYNFLISSGKWGRTPTGTFKIWIKLRYTKMEGGSKALNTYYYLPNVPYVMFFYNDKIPKWRGYGIHGTYWHDNFGHPMSHGCLNMKTEEVEKLYYWANPELKGKRSVSATKDNPGTQIIIYGKASWE